MGYYSRLQKAFEGALRLPLNNCSKYVIISDCHRGIGNANDNYMKNQTLHHAALSHYYRYGFTYIELGDGDELWENRSMKHIAERKNLTLIAGHTHRPVLSSSDPYYYNSGSCIHPYSITCLEIEQMHIRLVKWSLTARTDMTLQVTKEVLNGPVTISPQSSVILPKKK